MALLFVKISLAYICGKSVTVRGELVEPPVSAFDKALLSAAEGLSPNGSCNSFDETIY
jgi:hypothetical protein